MKKKKTNSPRILNTDTGAITFLLGVSCLAAALYLLTKIEVYEDFITWILPVLAIVLMIAGCIITILNRNEYEYELPPTPSPELRSSLESVMALAWEDHHHARNQTWEALKLEAILAVALIGVDLSSLKENTENITLVGSVLLFLLSISGMMITLHHRELERRKFRHIMHCEDALGVRPYIDGVKLPAPIYIWELFAFWKSNTVLFIMRMHLTILIFSLIFFISRLPL